jgi:hypothetical protein
VQSAFLVLDVCQPGLARPAAAETHATPTADDSVGIAS